MAPSQECQRSSSLPRFCQFPQVLLWQLQFNCINLDVTDQRRQQDFLIVGGCWAGFQYCKLKELFITASILHHPNLELPFLLEVDASNLCIEAILSQRQGKDSKLFPYAYFSCKFSPTEQNYDVGNRELLAIKETFEECRNIYAPQRG